MIGGLAFPNHHRFPAQLSKRLLVRSISLNIALQLGKPVVEPGFWDVGVDALAVLVPKAASYFNNLLQSSEHKIGFAGELCYVQPVAKPHSMNHAPHCHFRRCACTPNLAHVL